MTHETANSGEGVRAGSHEATEYADEVGWNYDDLYPADGLETRHTVEFVGELAERHRDRSVLELGIGTGRIAIGLHHRGLTVAGIDASERMVSQLREKAPDAPIDVAIGDYVTTRLDRSFSVVVMAFNSVLDHRGLSAQLALIENAARHVAPAGFLVIEAFVLSDEGRSGDWQVVPRYVGSDHVELQMARFDIETNMVERTLVHLTPEGPRFITVRDSYASPGELDVMAHVHGLRRVARYATWARTPFSARSSRHVTVYESPAASSSSEQSR